LGAKHDSVGTARAPAYPAPSEKFALAQNFLLFSGVSPADCVAILSSGHEKQIYRRQPLFSIGDPVAQIFFLLSGTVKITQVGAKGTEVILRLSGTGDLVGSVALWPECRHNSSAQAIQPCTAQVWDSPTFARLLEQFATLRRNTFQALEERLHETEQRLREISTEDVASRLSSELIRLSTRLQYGADGNEEVRLSHTDLAQLIGTTLSTVSRLLSRWQKLGIISVGRAGVQIRDVAALERFSQTE
jgi:CRP-like cAMP-binding protein